MNGCVAAVAPADQVVNGGIGVATLGASLLLPPRMTYIDMGEVLHGKPFGGDAALIQKAAFT